MININREFRKGILFLRIRGSLDKNNIAYLDYKDFKYVVINFDNLLAIDSYAINYIIKYSNRKVSDNGKLIICDSKNSSIDHIFRKKIPIIDNEMKAFKYL